MSRNLVVSLTAREAASRISDAIIRGSITGELLDTYTVTAPGGGCCIVSVYEKHYYRAGNRLTLTATVDDLTGRTRVHLVGGGGGEGLFRFDWGASGSFEQAAYEGLRPYQL